MNYPIRIRIGSANAGDPETRTYTDSTFAEAVAALQGNHDGESEYHRDERVYVVGTHAETHTVEGDGKRTRTVTYQAGEPMFGFEVTVYGRRLAFGGARDAEVNWSSGGSMGTEEAAYRMRLMALAVSIADAANAEPFCPVCQPELDRYAARKARMMASEPGVADEG